MAKIETLGAREKQSDAALMAAQRANAAARTVAAAAVTQALKDYHLLVDERAPPLERIKSTSGNESNEFA